MISPSTTRAPRAARRAEAQSRVQHLITADEHSLLDVEALLATLPLCATGRVFIEVPDASGVVPLVAPARMTVTWLVRAGRRGVRPRGALLARAACAWADEMLCEQDAAHTRVTLLGDYLGTADIVEHLSGLIDPACIRTPERYGLLAS